MGKCQQVVKMHISGMGYAERPCEKDAIIEKNGVCLCRHHAHLGRFVIRNGAVGEILARFNSEKEMRDAINNYPGMRMQKIKPGYRRDIV